MLKERKRSDLLRLLEEHSTHFSYQVGNIHADMKEPSEVGNSKQKGIRRISLQRFTAYNRGYTFQIANPYKMGDTTGVQHDDYEIGQLAGHKNPGPDHAGEDVEHRRQDRVRHLSP